MSERKPHVTPPHFGTCDMRKILPLVTQKEEKFKTTRIEDDGFLKAVCSLYVRLVLHPQIKKFYEAEKEYDNDLERREREME